MELCIDAGASSTKWSVYDISIGFRSGVSQPITGHIFDEIGFKSVKNVFADIMNSLQINSQIESLQIGITGLNKDSKISESLKIICKEVFLTENVTLVSDMELACQAVFPNNNGIVIYSGTGSIAIHRKQNGELIRAGGRGYLIGDKGGGFWIGKTALEITTSYWDKGKNPFDIFLPSKILEFTGSKNWDDLREFVYSGGRSAVSSLAKVVIECANNEDNFSINLLAEAGNELAKLGNILRERTGLSNFAALGGIFKSNTFTFNEMKLILGHEIRLVESDISKMWIEVNSKIIKGK